mmetsp:Transcript_14602/g.37798  ORF Transcript_14602/g.37798 Transcript_14602/m.37798 type:complete len:240 (+) Transcript_14602:122-841(+)
MVVLRSQQAARRKGPATSSSATPTARHSLSLFLPVLLLLLVVPVLCFMVASLPFVSGSFGSDSRPAAGRNRAVAVSMEAAKKTAFTQGQDRVKSGDQVLLMGHLGNYINAEPGVDYVKSRAPIQADRSIWTIEKIGGGPISAQDIVYLQGYRGGYMDVQGDMVRIKMADKPRCNGFVLTKGNDPKTSLTDYSPLVYGDIIYLRANGERNTYLDVEGQDVRARWPDEGKWQVITIQKPEA